jgi:hypothetical protein
MMESNNLKKDYIDSNKNNLFRRSALPRIMIGTISSTTIAVLYACAHAKYRKLEISFVANWLKGSSIASLSFYSLNEGLLAATKYYNVYTNFWINYSFICYYLSKVHYRYLIRNHIMKWYNAIRYSHKCFLYFCVFNLIIELGVYLYREVELYDDEDVFDYIKLNLMENGRPSFKNFTFKDLSDYFMTGFHVLNSSDKSKQLRRYMRENPNGSKVETIDLYEFYRTNNIK